MPPWHDDPSRARSCRWRPWSRSPCTRLRPPPRATASFGLCSGPGRVTCVVDGDTLWYRGEKIRIADINAPEVSHPACSHEAALGAQATTRLVVLLNRGPFTLEPIDRNRDRYGRLLRTVTRGGASVGEELVREGLAEQWKGYRGNWCLG